MLSTKQDQSLINGIAITQNAPKISHSFFADDSLIFCKAQKEEASHLKDIFQEYQRVSGQLINTEKSKMTFSPRINPNIKEEFTTVLPFSITTNITKYLGMPTQIGLSKQAVFGFIMERIRSKLKGWKEKHLSFAGRGILISAVIQALPTSLMSCFMLPKTMCDKIEKAICRFWWGSKEGQHKTHWKARKDLFKSKFQGGLGFRDMHVFNKALLAKQVWRLHTNPSSLLSLCLKAKYYSTTDILQATRGRQPIYEWQSIQQAIEIINKDSCWKIGNGQNVKIWEDNWLIFQNGFRVLTPQAEYNTISKVSDIITYQPYKTWNTSLIDHTFLHFERDQIQQIPLIMEHNEDQLMWTYTKEGAYSVKSGYNIIKAWQDTANPAPTSTNNHHTKMWKTLWSLHTIPRHKVLLWRIIQQVIPIKQALSRRGFQGQTLCPRCLRREETIEHVFKECQHADRIWFGSKLGIRFSSMQGSFLDWLIYAINNLNEEDLSYVAAICYGIWYARNQQVFEQRNIEEHETISKAQISIQEFNLALSNTNNNPSENMRTQVPRSDHNQRRPRIPNERKRWTKPRPDFIKINCDANLSRSGRWGLGATYRDADGELLAAATWELPGSDDAELAEACALYKGILLAAECCFHNIDVESDNATVIALLKSDASYPRSYLGNYVWGIHCNKHRFRVWFFNHISREANKAAHSVAALAHLEPNKIWLEETPPTLVSVLLSDLIN
jgi:hypothetical protein